jgi:Na+-driven multidrug efflux pump
MITLRLVIAIAFLLAALLVVVLNWLCAYQGGQNKKNGIKKSVSMIPMVSFILSCFAGLIYPNGERLWILLIPALDPSNWCLVFLPFILLKERLLKSKTEKA